MKSYKEVFKGNFSLQANPTTPIQLPQDMEVKKRKPRSNLGG